MSNPLDLHDRLQGLDACAVSDALDSLGLAGAVAGLVRRATRQCIAGPVRTLQLLAANESRARTHLGARSILVADPGEVIVVEQRTGIDAAAFGGVLANAAHLRGIAGVVVDGPVRDIDEYRCIGFPVFSRATTTRTARGRLREAAVDGPVTVGDVTVHPGDFVIADGSGVVFVAADRLDEILDKACDIAAREARMTEALHGGDVVTDVLGVDYENMLR